MDSKIVREANMEFTVQGEPTAKGRPRITKWGAHTPEKTVLYENLIKTEYRLANGEMHEGQLVMNIKAYFSIPKSASKKKHDQMVSGEIRPTKKPDADNILKVVADALNKIAYDDDSQIVKATISKYYSDLPRVEIEIKEAK